MSHFEGGCLCGSMRYEINAEPVVAAVCHCTHCRRQSGSAFSTVAGFPADAVTLTGDTLASFKDTGDSGMPVIRKFCRQCGSPLFSDAASAPGLMFFKTGTLDQPERIPMGLEIWCSAKLPETTVAEGLPQFDGNPPG